MQLDLDNLPSDTVLLHRLVRDIATVVEQRDGEIERLQLIIKQLQRTQFGRRSERLDADQLALGLEDVETDKACAEAAQESAAKPNDRKPRRKPLPNHLPREEVVVDVGAQTCACCGGALHPIGESVSEMLDWVPAQLRVVRISRPKYGCRTCGTMHQAPAPERPIVGGLATPALLAQVLVSKYCDHTPLYRQPQIFARHGVELDRSTLAGWVGSACWWLDALHERLCANVFASDHLFADDTPIPVLDPGRGRTKTGRLWVYARDQRPWGGTAPPAAVYVFAPDRKSERPAAHLEHFSGVLHVDGYAGFERLKARGNVVLAACWAHTRRYFYEFFEANGSPVAAEALRRIGELYAIEARIHGQSPAHRIAERRTFSKPLGEKLKLWLEQQLAHAPRRGKLAEAIRYALSRWDGLTRFLHDGRIELDTNPVERAIRPVALGRKNHLFAGSDDGGARWATLCSLIETAKLNDVEPYAYLHDVLQRMVDGQPINRLDELLPWNWKSAKAVKILRYVQPPDAYGRSASATPPLGHSCDILRIPAIDEHPGHCCLRTDDVGTNKWSIGAFVVDGRAFETRDDGDCSAAGRSLGALFGSFADCCGFDGNNALDQPRSRSSDAEIDPRRESSDGGGVWSLTS